MGMFDTISNVQVTCPRCGDEEPKSVQFKCGPQLLLRYEFGKERISIDWTYEFYNSIIDEDKKIIGGIATCQRCEEESDKKMYGLIQDARDEGELKTPEGAELLIECEIDGENALGVILRRLNNVYNGDRDIELFDVAITLNENNVSIRAEAIDEERQKELTEKQARRIKERRKKLMHTTGNVQRYCQRSNY